MWLAWFLACTPPSPVDSAALGDLGPNPTGDDTAGMDTTGGDAAGGDTAGGDTQVGPTWYADADGDTFGDPNRTRQAKMAPPGFVADATDCDDGAAAVHPGAAETCDGVDQDCDGTPDDDAVDAPAWHADADGDTFGDPAAGATACVAPPGSVADATDCDDADPTIHPGATERCDALDRDCDGTPDNDAVDSATWYADADGDTFGDPTSPAQACSAPPGTVSDDTDCDDTRAETFPGAPESCNGYDDNCDGELDEPEAIDAHDSYEDSDGDGYGNGAAMATGCEELEGFVRNPDDCNDGSATIHPSAAETCDALDQDCDGAVDEEATDASTWYADDDGDGYGDSTVTTTSCAAPAGYVADGTDCDDGDNTRAQHCSGG